VLFGEGSAELAAGVASITQCSNSSGLPQGMLVLKLHCAVS
jgi:hypothetical protein